jgi:hypothetical protein
MRFGLDTSIRRELFTSALLAVLVLRALVPTGFMPSADRPFSLQMCSAGFHGHSIDSQFLNSHPGKSSQFEHCPFGSAPGAGPVCQLTTLLPFWQSIVRPRLGVEPLRLPIRFDYAHQARAPPGLV